MKYKILITIILFLFSFLYLSNATNFIKKNDKLMQEITEKADNFYQPPINAIITQRTMIPGISGQKLNLSTSYQKMKNINKFNESLLVFDKIPPTKSIKNIYNKVIVSGNPNISKITMILMINDEYLFEILNQLLINNNLYLDIYTNNSYNIQNTNYTNILTNTYDSFTDYCLTTSLSINKTCFINHKYTILGEIINNYYLTKTKKIAKNGAILLYNFNKNNYQELLLIIKYLKNNNYNIVTIDKLIEE